MQKKATKDLYAGIYEITVFDVDQIGDVPLTLTIIKNETGATVKPKKAVLKVSVLSLSALVIGLAKEKLKGPMGVNQSTARPVELLILLLSLIESLWEFY